MAREGYLVNAGEDSIHDPAAEKKAEETDRTPRGKWNNFWYYHKIHVIIGAVAAVFAAFIISSSLHTVHPDYNVAMIVQHYYPDAVTDAIGKEMEKYGKDLNGDGKVVVQVNQYYFPPSDASGGTSGGSASVLSSGSAGTGAQNAGDAQMVVANRTKMAGDLSLGTSIIFLTDDASFRSQEIDGSRLFAYLDGSTPKAGAADFDRMRVPAAKTRLAGVKIRSDDLPSGTALRVGDVLPDLSISLRAYYGTSIEGKQKDYYEASKALFRKIVSQP